ncbi:MAG: DsrE/DsrF/DrsH-like family protein, partial [Bacteroidales bacterium]
IPLDELRSRLTEIPQNKKIIVFCGVGQRAYLACRILYQYGFTDVYNLSGGFKIYSLASKDIADFATVVSEFQSQDKPTHSLESLQTPHIVIDACGLQCPGPIQKLKKSIDEVEIGKTLTIKATDPGFKSDIYSWCKITGHTLLSVQQDKGVIEAVLQKNASISENKVINTANGQTIIVFSDDMDKALASFVLANGGIAAGKKVTMFFTFWGLNVIKKQNKPKVKKDFMGAMFGMMMAKSSLALTLSKMNMFGMGTYMMRKRMESLKIDSLEKMIQDAIHNGVEMIACNMSMEVMGVKKEELLDHAQIGGVAAYIEKAQSAGINLFI